MAAARVKLLTPHAILGRLEQQLPILTGGARDAPARQQTMRDAIDWSFDLLSRAEQQLLRQLAVFVGGWTLEAAAAVCDADLDTFGGLVALVDHSLVRSVEGGSGETRYTLLETIREFGLEQLSLSGEEVAIRQRHAKFFLALAELAEPQLAGREQAAWLHRLRAEHDNIRAALAWLRAGRDAEQGLRLAIALRDFWFDHGLAEGLSHVRWFFHDSGATLPLPIRARALGTLGFLTRWQGDYQEARRLSQEALVIWETLGDWSEVPFLLLHLGLASADAGDIAATTAYWERNLTLAREVGDVRSLASSLLNLAGMGTWAAPPGDTALAVTRAQEGLVLAREVGDQETTATALRVMGLLAVEQGEVRDAIDLFRQSMLLYQELGSLWGMAKTVSAFAMIALADAQLECAVRLFSTADELRTRLGMPPSLMEPLAALSDTLVALRSALGDDVFAVAWSSGRELPFDAIMAEVERLDQMLAAHGSEATPHATAGLTPRELDVLRLLVEGQSNQEITTVLFISQHTVANHVASILNKLGVDSRTAAASWAICQGII